MADFVSRFVDAGVRLRVGLCLPLGAEMTVRGHRPADSLAEMEADGAGDRFYHDTEAGVVFLAVVGTARRGRGDTRPCGERDDSCRRKTIVIRNSNRLDMGRADCRNRTSVYPKYQIQ